MQTLHQPNTRAWLAVNSSFPQQRQHKSTILRFYSSPLTVAQSKDHLKRVRGFSQFDEHVRKAPDIETLVENGKMLAIENPVLTLVQCNGSIFFAVVKVLDIWVNAVSQQMLPAHLLYELHVRIRS